MRARQAGFALLIVLWALVLLSLILTQLLSAGRSEAQLAGNLDRAAVAEAVADGAVAEALFHLVAGGAQRWAPRGTHAVRIGRGLATVAIADLSDKINPQTADLPLLSALIGQCDATAAQARQLAAAIMSWRGTPLDPAADPAAAYQGMGYVPLGLPLQTLDELRLVAGMTPTVYACLAPHMSLFQPGAPVAGDDALVARALAAAVAQGKQPGQAADSTGVAQITAVAEVAGARFMRRATVQLTAPPRIVAWEAPPPR